MVEPEIIRHGDHAGNKMLVRYTTPSGATIHGIGVPQSWDTPLGPTWCYVVEGDGLTLVDPGCHGSVGYLQEALDLLGFSLTAVDRVVVTHGHLDHDGSCLSVVEKSGAQLWAHEVYGAMLHADRWEREMAWRREVESFRAFENSETVERVKDHHERAQRLTLDQPVTDGDTVDGLTFYYTPGHSPDELCIEFDRMMFTGDHVLPLITPHPSVSRSYRSFKASLPESYRNSNEIYGLKVLIRSLLRVAAMGDDIAVLPAHRAFHRGKFNMVGLERAGEIVEHHRARCYDLIEILRRGPMRLTELTREHFSYQELEVSNFFLAYSEVMSHVELMQESGDVSVIGGAASGGSGESGGLVRWNGTERYSRLIDSLTPAG